MIQLLLWLWASPASLLGLGLGASGLPTGTRFRRVGRTLEIYGGLIKWLLERTPVRAAAMTLGHVIIGQDAEMLDRCREHELVHVRQYERWGPFFIPAYLSCSVWLWLRGRNAYLDNPFEVEAYESDMARSLS